MLVGCVANSACSAGLLVSPFCDVSSVDSGSLLWFVQGCAGWVGSPVLWCLALSPLLASPAVFGCGGLVGWPLLRCHWRSLVAVGRLVFNTSYTSHCLFPVGLYQMICG